MGCSPMQSLTITGVAIVVEFKTITAGAANAVFILMAVVLTVVGGVVVTTPAARQVWTAENRRMSNRKQRTEGCQTGNAENGRMSNTKQRERKQRE